MAKNYQDDFYALVATTADDSQTTQGKTTFINIYPETVKMEATVTSDKNKTSADKNMLILDSSSQDDANAEDKE